MPLRGEDQPSPAKWVRDQVAETESSGGTKGTKLRGVPVVVITSRGAQLRQVEKEPCHAGRARWRVRRGRI